MEYMFSADTCQEAPNLLRTYCEIKRSSPSTVTEIGYSLLLLGRC